MPRLLRTFLSSPGDVAEERVLAERVFRRLNSEFAHSVRLELILWEHEPLFAHSGFQQQLPRASQCDLVVSVLWARLGTRLPADFAVRPGQPSLTGTEFEITDALEAYRRMGRPNLLIYRKTARPQVDLTSVDAEERLLQYRRLQDFCQRAFYDAQGAAAVATHQFAHAYDFERKLYEHARRWLERQLGGDLATRPRWTAGSPYRGLQAFHAEHHEIYFGRSQAVSELMSLLRATEARPVSGENVTRWLLIQGMSGNGKTSLVRAGLLPLLEGRALEGIGLWYQVILKPSDRFEQRPETGPVGALAASLAQAIPAVGESYPGAVSLAARLHLAPAECAARLDGDLTREATRVGLKPQQMRLVVFIDQLEELFERSLAVADRSALIAALHSLAREGRIWVIGTIRSDFISLIEEHADLLTLTSSGHLYILGPPHPDELADMIREPAQAAGLSWETKDGVSLDQSVLREGIANPESLPLLEYALDQLYARRDGTKLTFGAYQALGGLAGGIAASAEAVLATQGAPAVEVLPGVLRALVRVDESGNAVRRHAHLEEFLAGSAERSLVEELIRQRLLVSDAKAARPIVALAHEALLRSWPRLTQWLAGERGLLQDRATLEYDARSWCDRGRSRDWLATTADRLAMHERLVTAHVPLSGAAQDFVAASRGYAAEQHDAAQNALAAYFSLRAEESWLKDRPTLALRYALAAYEAGRPRGAGARSLLVRAAYVAPRGVLLASHAAGFNDAAFAPDGSLVATASEDGTARLVDALTGGERVCLQHDAPVELLAFAPDGERVVTVCGDGMIRVWNVSRGNLTTQLRPRTPRARVEHVAFAPDGRLLLTERGGSRVVRLWDAATGEQSMLTHDAVVSAAAWSPDGRYVATVSEADRAVHIWDPASGRELRQLRPEGGAGRFVMFSPDGTRLASACGKSDVLLWDTGDWEEVAHLPHEGSPIQIAAWSPDGRRLVTAPKDAALCIWDVDRWPVFLRDDPLAERPRTPSADQRVPQETGRTVSPGRNAADEPVAQWRVHAVVISHLTHSGEVQCLSFTADNKRVVAAANNGDIFVWNVTTGHEYARLEHPGATVARPSPDGSRVLVAGSGTTSACVWDHATGWECPQLADDGYVYWDATGGPRLARFDHLGRIVSALFTPDGSQIIAGSDESRHALVWDVKTGERVAWLTHDSFVCGSAVSPNGVWLATACDDRTVHIWDLAAARSVARLEHTDDIRGVAFSPDGSRLATASHDGNARLWNATNGAALCTLAHRAAVHDIAFSPNGSHLVSAGSDGTARLWEVSTGHEILHLAHGGAVHGTAWAPDGRTIATASADGAARLWDSKGGREVATLNHGGDVMSAGFSPDSTIVLTVAADSTARLWDAGSGRELARLRHDGAVASARFSPDGSRVVTASHDGSVRVYAAQDGVELIRLYPGEQPFVLGYHAKAQQAQFSPAGTQVLACVGSEATIWDVTLTAAASDALMQRVCSSIALSPKDFTEEELLADPVLARAPAWRNAISRLSRIAPIANTEAPASPARKPPERHEDSDR